MMPYIGDYFISSSIGDVFNKRQSVKFELSLIQSGCIGGLFQICALAKQCVQNKVKTLYRAFQSKAMKGYVSGSGKLHYCRIK